MAALFPEALSVVSEDQPIFEPPYSAAPTMHMKSEMTSPGSYGQASKPSPEPAESEWGGSAAQNSGKRGEHVNRTSRESPVDCSVTKRSRHMSSDGAPMPYQASYPEPRVSPQTATPPSSTTEEKRVIVPADYNKQNYDKPDNKPKLDKPDYDKLEYDKPDDDKPEYKKPDCDKQDYDKPDYNKPEYDKPEYDKPEYDKPENDKPEYDKPDCDKPDYNKPEYDKPDYNKPGLLI
ncbi:Friend leukemia integration 1 transcription factor [Austrofundulus limnaeus]|uniref:Friend leukemia integration 1 transcription factor n=1 Tax=Austrofundulus limnaeus TaxID=52670 RepID=A0A2I4CVZ3_AUSLI|nr:PREDICTED: Friend leukemia integration 1 transcription factor-like [Austrofundulus limnaeus]